MLCLAAVVGETVASDRKAEYVHAVTRGAGWVPWQERGLSEAERTFREGIEGRKTRLLSGRTRVQHPALLSPEALERARHNIATTDWARDWFESIRTLADDLVARPPSWVEQMIPEESPAHGYGFTCPNCVGRLSQEATGYGLIEWSYKEPEVLACRKCGQRYPDTRYPETARLEMPRSAQTITYYLSDAERADPDNRSGELAWHWVGYPVHVSFTGVIREKKILFMRDATKSLALAYALTGDARYALRAKEILVRLARCYRNWLYRDYWGTYADCDPMYAAWHDKELPIEWKRHLCEQAYAKDTLEKAAMRQSYWGAGRMHPSTDSISGLVGPVFAYDLTYDATLDHGRPVWSEEERALVERDFFLEYIMGAEPFVGGADRAENANNKSPRVYNAMAAVAKCLGLPRMADTALRGYERVRDESFLYDGFSRESPAYTNMYLSQLLVIPETLHGFAWPEGFSGRTGAVDLYARDAKLRRMYEAVLQVLRPEGCYLPLSDTRVDARPSLHIALMGLRRYPDLYAGTLPSIYGRVTGEYAVFHASEEALTADEGLHLRETLFPAWQTAILRHGTGTEATVLALAFNPDGGHRHADNLALFYADGGDIVLGDQGYMCDMPLNSWIKSTYSHNLVVVDGQKQKQRGRNPEFELMATSPLASVVEATSDAYPQCTDYRRRVVLIKGPNNRSIAVDIFRVAGGSRHAYRVYSELASGDAEEGVLEFEGVSMPPEAPLPEVGASLIREDIFGLRDVRTATPEGDTWTATWRESGRAYRLWMCTPCDRVEASNGPGQRTLEETGRRVRYVDAVREGEVLESLYVAVHEPCLRDGSFPLRSVETLPLQASAGNRAVGLRMKTAWGVFYLFNDVEEEVHVDGIRVRGRFALAVREGRAWKEAFACAVSRFMLGDGCGLETEAQWAGQVTSHDTNTIHTNTAKPDGWPSAVDGVGVYVRARTAGGWTGFPVFALERNAIRVERYPLPPVTEFSVPSWWYEAFNVAKKVSIR